MLLTPGIRDNLFLNIVSSKFMFYPSCVLFMLIKAEVQYMYK